MKFDISKTEKSVGEKFEIKLLEVLDNFIYNGIEYKMSKPAVFEGMYFPKDGYVKVIGNISLLLISACNKCLCDTEFNLKFEIDETFKRDSDDEDIYLFEGYEINLEKAVMDNIVLNLPLFLYCKPDCKGLCKNCGIDLNKKTCDCEEKESVENSPFNILGELFNDDKEV